MKNGMLERERTVVRDIRMEEFTLHLRGRFHAIMLREPRNLVEIAREIGVSRDMMQSFITGARKTHYRSLCKLEIWIKKEEERLGIE